MVGGAEVVEDAREDGQRLVVVERGFRRYLGARVAGRGDRLGAGLVELGRRRAHPRRLVARLGGGEGERREADRRAVVGVERTRLGARPGRRARLLGGRVIGLGDGGGGLRRRGRGEGDAEAPERWRRS